MQSIAPQCPSCGAFPRRSLHHEKEYQQSMHIQRLRTTNFPATEKEITHIRHAIFPTIREDISSIESKAAALYKIIRSMEEEGARLQSICEQYNNLTSLHRSLPPEILADIFLHVHASGSIWMISRVCSRWRDVALSLHSAWSTMEIGFSRRTRHKRDVQRLETMIHRSRPGSLDLSLTDDFFKSDPSTLERMLELVVKESCRWRSLHLLDWTGSFASLYARLRNRLPCLESLTLTCTSSQAYTGLPGFMSCPRLTKLSLGSRGALRVRFPWDQIKELDFSCLLLENEDDRTLCSRAIEQCLLLEVLTMPPWNLPNDTDGMALITCFNLRKLKVFSGHTITSLTLPCLQEAFLQEDHGAPTLLPSFQQLLTRSGSLNMLTRLSLEYMPLAVSPEQSLHSILVQTNNLTFLQIHASVSEYFGTQEQLVTIIDSLDVIAGAQAVTFLPRLSFLALTVASHSDCMSLPYFGAVGMFVSMLQIRWKGNGSVGLSRLRTCHFTVQAKYLKHVVYRDAGYQYYVEDVFIQEERQAFDKLIDEGMDLSIQITSEVYEGRNVVFAVTR